MIETYFNNVTMVQKRNTFLTQNQHPKSKILSLYMFVQRQVIVDRF